LHARLSGVSGSEPSPPSGSCSCNKAVSVRMCPIDVSSSSYGVTMVCAPKRTAYSVSKLAVGSNDIYHSKTAGQPRTLRDPLASIGPSPTLKRLASPAPANAEAVIPASMAVMLTASLRQCISSAGQLREFNLPRRELETVPREEAS
jgi:hypothetical protein